MGPVAGENYHEVSGIHGFWHVCLNLMVFCILLSFVLHTRVSFILGYIKMQAHRAHGMDSLSFSLLNLCNLSSGPGLIDSKIQLGFLIPTTSSRFTDPCIKRY